MTATTVTLEQALANLTRHAVFGNAYGVSGSQMPDGSTYWTGWISGFLYSSRDGVRWASVDVLWRTS